MARQVIGGRWYRRWGLRLSLALAVGAGAIYVQSVLAVWDLGIFQLDGDASTATWTIPTTPQSGDDWDRVCYQYAITHGSTSAAALSLCGTSQGTTNSIAVSWEAEPSPSSTIFTGGGSKDPIDINQWAWKNDANAPPDKDNLIHAYAARYFRDTCPKGSGSCDIIYFGSDRFDNSGDAQQGFWFLQHAITTSTTKVGGGFGFSSSGGTEFPVPGDVLVISDFSNGGTTSTISVYQWDPTCKRASGSCADANLRLLSNLTGTAANCATAQSNAPACGIVNPASPAFITMPWSFLDKSNTPNNEALNGEFYEAGLNLTNLGLAGECFSTVVSETRSSQSTGAVLKDFVVGTFGQCETGIATQPMSGGNEISTVSIGTGVVSVSDAATITVTGKATWSGSVSFWLCGPTALDVDPPNCATGGTAVGSPQTVDQSTLNGVVTSDAVTISSVGNYCWRGVFTSNTSGVPTKTESSAAECFTVTPVTPTLTTSASADVGLGNAISDTAQLTGTATQPGSTVINGSAGSPAGGTITFNLYGPDDNTCTTSIYSKTVTVSGDSTSYGGASTVSYTPTQAGTYRWVASYGGSAPNTLAASPSACLDSAEDVVVTSVPTSISTAQTLTLKDTATISATAGGNLAGSVRFRLYTNATCSGTAIYDSGSVAVSGASPQVVSTTTSSSLVFTSTQSTLSWLVQYSSTNGNQQDSASACNVENASLTINNNNQP